MSTERRSPASSSAPTPAQSASGLCAADRSITDRNAPEDAATGDRFWRTAQELADDPVFQEWLRRRYPSHALLDPVARRTFLRLLGAPLVLAGFTACTRQPAEKIVPYVRQPEEIVPGKPLFFATAMSIGGVATGLLVESHEGRPTKVEGNPQHPGSLGATDVFAQAATLDLYDPDRSRAFIESGEIRSWSSFVGAMRSVLNAQQPLRGAGIRILTESVGSPTLAWQLRQLLAALPAARWHQWDPASRDHARAGARLAFGDYVDVQYRFDRADVVLALDTDPIDCGPGALRYAHDFASRRRPERADRMSRVYAVESMPSLIGSKADHRLKARAREVESVARQIAARLGVVGADAGVQPLQGSAAQIADKWIAAVAADLQAHRGASLVVAGDGQPASVHALAHAMNELLGNVGNTLAYTDPIEAEPVDQVASLRELTSEMNGGRVDLLMILGGNPVYTAPADVGFAAAMNGVTLRVHLGRYEDETSALCHWHIPEAHFLEAWSDARAFDGTASIVQPLIAPLYGGKSAHEVLATLGPTPMRSGYDILRECWSSRFAAGITPELGRPRSGADVSGPPPVPTSTSLPAGAPPGVGQAFERAWRQWLHDGVVSGTVLPPRAVSVRAGAIPPAPAHPSGVEVVFRNDPSVLDGRFANNGWLQELPKPITKLTWDNAVLMSPRTAERLKVGGTPATTGGEHGQITSDVVELRYRGRAVQGAVFPVVGHADDSITLHLGYGRRRGGRVAAGAGFNANEIRTSDALSFGSGIEIVKTGRTYPLACTQYHHLMEGRGLVRAVTRDEFLRDPRSVQEGAAPVPAPSLTLYPEYPYAGYKWGMAVDVNACIGCNACVVACVAENNVCVVGKDQVTRGREMHWLRIDTYYRGSLDRPETYFQPVPCQQCENAPCELVCPVMATVHSSEGLNDMVYNRCVGTRYCSNNCPYKVRRFNFYLYQDWETPSLKLGRNPDVTVRSRGVMEKCTYCVQRINAAKIDAEEQNRRVRDGEIQTACQAACPTQAIVFGDLNDPASRVAQLHGEDRSYPLLGELNTRPRTKYLAALRNVNAELSE
jgi:MoCo/4Fe-4S cofactor protein with predicted Tat translocation signal